MSREPLAEGEFFWLSSVIGAVGSGTARWICATVNRSRPATMPSKRSALRASVAANLLRLPIVLFSGSALASRISSRRCSVPRAACFRLCVASHPDTLGGDRHHLPGPAIGDRHRCQRDRWKERAAGPPFLPDAYCPARVGVARQHAIAPLRLRPLQRREHRRSSSVAEPLRPARPSATSGLGSTYEPTHADSCWCSKRVSLSPPPQVLATGGFVGRLHDPSPKILVSVLQSVTISIQVLPKSMNGCDARVVDCA